MTDVATEEERGREARRTTPRGSHAGWAPPAGRADPVALLLAQDAAREADLVPIRHQRMSVSAFTFFRGAAAVMAADLATTPTSGLRAQLCGDAHLANFGVFASPERRLLFDLNDFDETLPGPWEWDVKRLATSFVVASRDNGFPADRCAAAAQRVVSTYRKAMRSFARAGVLETWYARTEAEDIDRIVDRRVARPAARAQVDRQLAKARARTSARAVRKLARVVDGRLRVVDDPPLVVPLETIAGPEHAEVLHERIREVWDDYLTSLSDDRRTLLERFRVEDVAHKVVGVGSVGMRSLVVLLTGRDVDDPLVLQLKEAGPSVLEPFAGASRYATAGERVVQGQRLLQAASDPFLGWSRGIEPSRHYYWRQLMDMKGSADVAALVPEGMEAYARLCGWTLARAHARSGSPAAIAGYLGRKPAFDEAVTEFALAYADQNAADHEAHARAIADGRVVAAEGVT